MNIMKEKINFQKIALTSIATVGLIGVAVLAPNILQVARQFSNNKKYNRKDYINRAISNLIEKDFIRLQKKNGKSYFILTEKGELEFGKYELQDFEIKKPKKWDKKWRVVIFDIQEKKRNLRTLLRDSLRRLGFIKLQNSVWVYPYECEELIFLLKTRFFLGRDVLYMVVDKIENDRWLKEVFGLK